MRPIHGHRPRIDGKSQSSPTYASWLSMRQRCINENSKHYKNYRGRGITICERWGDYRAFLADMGERPEGTSLERIDNDGNYCKENCRWATMKEQNNNRRCNRILEVNGLKLNVTQWAEKTGLKRQTIFQRLHRGWSITDAVTKPLERQGKKP